LELDRQRLLVTPSDHNISPQPRVKLQRKRQKSRSKRRRAEPTITTLGRARL
jgi:hypothetical protein